MQTTAVDLVTVSREYGAGGSEFALALGTALGWPVLDKNLPERVAARLRVKCGAVERCDEQAPGLLGRIASTLLVSTREASMQIETNDLLLPDWVARAAHAEIVDAAANPPAVVVGHGAQMILRGRRGTMHVRLIGTEESCVDRLIGREGVTASEAAASARRINGQRQAYVQRYYHRYWADPTLFDIQFNTARVTIAQAVECVTSVIAARVQGQPVHALSN